MALNQHLSIGRLGERIVADYYVKKGCFVLERNLSQPFGEIDLIVKKHHTIYFVEVKTRTQPAKIFSQPLPFFRPEHAVSREKMRKFKNMIAWYINSNPHLFPFDEKDVELRIEISVEIAAVRICKDTHNVKIKIIKAI